MIWIATLCLLAIAAWLFFNALNERRWVEAHSHDETVASDQGLFPSFTAITGTAIPYGDGKVTINQENTRFARTVARVQKTTGKLGDKFFEAKAAAARVSDSSDRPRSASEEDTMFGRMVAKVGAKAASIDERLEIRMKAASSQALVDSSNTSSDGGTFFEKATRKVAQKSDEVSQLMANRAKMAAEGYALRPSASEEGGMFGKMVEKVSLKMDTMEKKIEERVARSRIKGDGTRGLDASDDLITRVSAKVGTRINEIDEKIVKASRQISDKLDK